ncbi:MotA/TolQ/ExbB proton channel family protein [Metabacillus sp. B2-18]|uniref:MotA/TolQ/ExbB proton channel family protein n=1 Tax=Metabacillus sp. B2-18 TaxID=2897333 RepID=UPI001E301D66|nr:MotA/TolQ/ExbB proton channel family protein [Metabacillus sp. B2-18]UGB33153.1 MotA/TolQ/ExbB proton channel family protein [Metabacillus sp. B2-18]
MFSIFEDLFQNISSMGVEGFTNIFLVFQLFLFFILCFFQTTRIVKEMRVMDRLKKNLSEINRGSNKQAHEIDQEINDLFSIIKGSRYKDLWSRYYNRVSEKNEDERIRVEPFFGFDVMHYHMGYRPLMDVGAGINVSIGVLGTFIGLSTGLADLNMGDTDALRTGISGLLDGMKVAFYSSVFGVFLSLAWTLFDRVISSQLDKKIDWHSEKLDYLLSTDDEELFLNRLEKISRSQADHLKTLLTDALEKAMQPIVSTIRESNGQVSNAFGALNDQFSKLQSGVETQSKLLETQIEFSKSNSNDISDRLVEQITGGTQQSISQFTNIISDTKDLQQQMMQTVNTVVEKFASSEQTQSTTLERTEKMFAQFENMTSELDQMRSSYKEASSFMEGLSGAFQQIQHLTQEQLPVQQEVMKSNQSLAEKYDGLTERFKEFNSAIETKYENLMDEVITVSKSLSTSFKDMTDRFSQSLVTQSTMMKESDTLLQNVKEVVEYLTPVAPELKDVVGNIHSLKEQLSQMQQLQNELLPELVEMKTNTNKTVEEALATTKSYMNEMTNQLDVMKTSWTTTREQFEQTRETLNTSVKDFSENVDNGLSKTYHHFDETLTNAVKQVSQLVYQFSDVQKDFIDTLEDLSEEISKAKAGA